MLDSDILLQNDHLQYEDMTLQNDVIPNIFPNNSISLQSGQALCEDTLPQTGYISNISLFPSLISSIQEIL